MYLQAQRRVQSWSRAVLVTSSKGLTTSSWKKLIDDVTSHEHQNDYEDLIWKMENRVRKKVARRYGFLPHRHDTERREAWNFFVVLLYGSIGSPDAEDDTEDCKIGLI